MIDLIAQVLIILTSSGIVARAVWSFGKKVERLIDFVGEARDVVPKVEHLIKSVNENTLAIETVTHEFVTWRTQLSATVIDLVQRVTKLEGR